MSAVSNYFAIVGYDLTDCKRDTFGDWLETGVGKNT